MKQYSKKEINTKTPTNKARDIELESFESADWCDFNPDFIGTGIPEERIFLLVRRLISSQDLIVNAVTFKSVVNNQMLTYDKESQFLLFDDAFLKMLCSSDMVIGVDFFVTLKSTGSEILLIYDNSGDGAIYVDKREIDLSTVDIGKIVNEACGKIQYSVDLNGLFAE